MSDQGASEEFDRVLESVRERVDPDAEERERLAAAAERLLKRTREVAAEVDADIDVLQVGSTARGTWVSGDRDVDVFVRFPPEVAPDRLEELGLRLGHEVLPDGQEEYAEHPYVTGEFEGFDVDLVPCYRLEDASEVRSAVDRTPFHTDYLADHLEDDVTVDVRLCKAFLKGIGVYGSDLRTRGIGGYLAELLVLEYGDFRTLLEAVADWRPPVRLDPGDTGSDATFEDPLVVVDPTDAGRNVAAVVASESVARFQHYAREFLDTPRESLFDPNDPAPLSPTEVREHLDRRGTTPVALSFRAPDVVEDQLYPQLRRTRSNLVQELDRRGFQPLRSTAVVDRETEDTEDRAVVLIECAVDELSTVERHEGPPVAVRDHAMSFYEKYDATDDYGPFLDGDRYVVERAREFTSPGETVEAVLFDVGLGPDVERAVERDHEVLVGESVASLAERPGLGRSLRRYFDPMP